MPARAAPRARAGNRPADATIDARRGNGARRERAVRMKLRRMARAALLWSLFLGGAALVAWLALPMLRALV